jgi:hypothetical protein
VIALLVTLLMCVVAFCAIDDVATSRQRRRDARLRQLNGGK